MYDFRRLRAWHAAHKLAISIADSIPEGAARRVPGLRGQIVRAPNSVPFNLAEGCGRPTRTEFLQFIDYALGSLNELDAQLLMVRDHQIVTPSTYSWLYSDLVVVRKMICSLRESIAGHSGRGE